MLRKRLVLHYFWKSGSALLFLMKHSSLSYSRWWTILHMDGRNHLWSRSRSVQILFAVLLLLSGTLPIHLPAHPRCISDRHLVLDNKKAPYSSPVRQWADAIFWIHILLQKKTNERLLLCFMSHLSMIILSHCKTEKKIFMVSAWLVFGYGWSVFG